MTRPMFNRLVAASVLILLTGACASGGGNSGEPAPATDAKIDTFTYGLEAIPGTLDVSDNYNSADMAVMGLVTQPLEIPNLDGTFTPVLAESVTTPDNKTIVYDLNPDATFSDGSKLTAEDVVWTIAHLREDTTQTVSELTNLKIVKATGPNQVTITLAAPNPAQRGAFAIISFIQQAKYGEASGEALGTPEAPPVGTGPYKISAFSANGISLVRNPEFTSKEPVVDSLEFTTIADDNAAQLAMRSDELDGYALLDIKTTDLWKSVPGASTWSSPTLYLDYITMDTSKAPFNDVNVRRAISYATDVDGLLEANYGDQARPPMGLTPPETVAQVEPDADAFAKVVDEAAAYPFSVEDAKAELAKSAYPDGFKATYEYYSPTGKLVGVSMAENLKPLGIELELKSRRIGDYIGDLFVGKFPQIGFFSIAAVVPDPSSWYLYLVGEGNPYNASQYFNDETNAALVTLDTGETPERWEAVTTLIDKMAEDVPYVGLAQPEYVYVLGDGLTFSEEPDFIQMTSGNWINMVRATE